MGDSGERGEDGPEYCVVGLGGRREGLLSEETFRGRRRTVDQLPFR
jgi:hypothetical protein